MGKKREHAIHVELTAYGWEVTENGEHRGLFVNKDAALRDVRTRGQTLTKQGRIWSYTVIGVEQPSRSKPQLYPRR
jgi:hypothetical protein